MTLNTVDAAEPISVSTASEIYYNGDFVVVYGSVDTIFENMPITIQIYYESMLVDIAQVPVAKDGTFVDTFNAFGPLWKDEGTYVVRAFYTEKQIAETTFEFFNEIIDKSSAIFPVDIPNSGTFDIGYTIRGGEVLNMDMNLERYSITIETEVDSNGNIILKLPRESFDAQADGEDETFIILISKASSLSDIGSFEQIEYEEVETGNEYRTVRIPLEEGDKWIEVIGTYVIPEFGSIVMIILLVAVASTIIISRSKLSVRYN